MRRHEATIPIFIPSYHRADNLKTAKYYIKRGYPPELVYVFIDSEADDKEQYMDVCKTLGCNLVVFDMEEARDRYDYVHRPSVSRRSAGQARNMFYDFAIEHGIGFYLFQDDDTLRYQIRPFQVYQRLAELDDVVTTFEMVREMMERQHIGLFGLPQTGDIYINEVNRTLFRKKVMNTTFVNVPYVYRGERGVQDDDTTMFVVAMNEGYFTGSLWSGLVLKQTPSATAKGGLTDLYVECKLLNKALVTPIQFPSAIYAENQKRNGGRLHHHVRYRYLFPCILKIDKEGRGNLAWDKYPEDGKLTNEPKRAQNQRYINGDREGVRFVFYPSNSAEQQ